MFVKVEQQPAVRALHQLSVSATHVSVWRPSRRLAKQRVVSGAPEVCVRGRWGVGRCRWGAVELRVWEGVCVQLSS